MMDESGLILGAAAPTGKAADQVEDVTTANFKAKVIDESASRPVLVDFWAPWCGPCKQLAPVLEKVVASTEGRVKLVKMNIDDHPQIAGQLGIKSIPAVIAFQKGQPADGFMGAVPESQIKGFIERLIGPIGNAAKELLEAAEVSLRDGNFDKALEGFQSAIEADDTSAEGYGGLARTLLAMGDLDGAKEFIDSLEENIQTSPALSAIKAEIHLAEQAGTVGDLAELENRVKQNPKDHQARFDLALGLNGAGKFEDAADQLLEIIRIDRNWNDEAARKKLLEFFDAWGMSSEHTASARRKLSAALFS